MNTHFAKKLISLIDELPMIQHPWFKGIIDRQFTKEQIIAGEFQHYLRVKRNDEIFGAVVINSAQEGDYETLEIARKILRNETLGAKTHTDLMFQFLEELGCDKTLADRVDPMPGTMAGIEMLVSGAKNMTGLEGIAMLSLPEYQNDGATGVAGQVYRALTSHYCFSEYAAESFLVHAHDDVAYGSTLLALLVKRVGENPELQGKVLRAARFGINAFNFEWDGHYQAATKCRIYWAGPNPECIGESLS